MIQTLEGRAIFLNPMGAKTYDTKTKKWDMAGVDPSSRVIVKHDFWCVDQADIFIANMLSLSEGYPSIGSFYELGRASGTKAITYLILDPDYKARLHPFFVETAAAIFDNPLSCMSFLYRQLDVLSGANPHYDGDLGAN
jgi:hypothetical protein